MENTRKETMKRILTVTGTKVTLVTLAFLVYILNVWLTKWISTVPTAGFNTFISTVIYKSDSHTSIDISSSIELWTTT